MVLGDVEETHTSIEVDEETLEESITVRFYFGCLPQSCIDPNLTQFALFVIYSL